MAREDGKTVGEGSHEGRAVLLVDDHMVDKAENGSQEELEEEATSNGLAIHLKGRVMLSRKELVSSKTNIRRRRAFPGI